MMENAEVMEETGKVEVPSTSRSKPETKSKFKEKEEDVQADTEPVELWEILKDWCKRKDYEVLVTGFSKTTSEDDLKEVFKDFGEIIEVRLMMKPEAKNPKDRVAFLRFATVEAKAVLEKMPMPWVNGKACKASLSKESDILLLSPICRTWTKEDLQNSLSQYTKIFHDLQLIEDGSNTGRNRGIAFLEFFSSSDLGVARKCLLETNIDFGTGKQLRVATLSSMTEPNLEIIAQDRTVRVVGLPASWDENSVKMHLCIFGAIEKVVLAVDISYIERTDFAYVTFETYDNAVRCVRSIHHYEFDEGENKVKLGAKLGNPLQRGNV